MKNTLPILAAIAATTAAHAQFGLRFDDETFTAQAYRDVYTFESGQVMMMTATPDASEEGYIFVDPNTGELLSSFRLDRRHGALLSPDQSELLMAGSDGTIRTIARYSATTLDLIERVGIQLGDSLSNTTGIGGNFEVSSDGTFIFKGSDLNQEVNFVEKFDNEFNQVWATSFQYEGMYSQIGVEAYPLDNGDVGIFLFNIFDPQTSQFIDVFGLLDGGDGSLRWTFTYRPPLNSFGSRLEDFRFTFGRDGSFFAHAAAILDITNPLAPIDDSSAKILRINPDGTLAYSKTVTLEDAVVKGQDYMGGYALLHFVYNDEDSTQFVVINPNGQVSGNTAIDEHLSAGDGDLTATRRDGTDIAFIRADFSPGGSILARLDLTNGDMEFRQLPTLLLGVPDYDAVGKVTANVVAPFFTPQGFTSVSPVLAAESINGLSNEFRMDLIELPADGSFPTCIDLRPSNFATVTPLFATVTDSSIIDLEDGWTESQYSGLPGLSASDVTPSLLPMNVSVEILCEDDAAGQLSPSDLMVTLVKTGADTAELSFQTIDGAQYRIHRSITRLSQDSFSLLEDVEGDGERHTVSLTLGNQQFYIIKIVSIP